MFQNQEAEAFPATGCEEQWSTTMLWTVLSEVEGNNPVSSSCSEVISSFSNRWRLHLSSTAVSFKDKAGIYSC